MIRKQEGFTAVELLITLFVAAAFLIASYQLFNLVIKDGGATRAESRASNVAYDYMRQYASSATTIPCTQSSPLSDSAITVDGLTNATVDVDVNCAPDAPTSLSEVTVTVSYNAPRQTVTYTTYTSATGNTATSDITNGLAAWWKLNGDATASVGSPDGVITDAVPTTHNAIQNTAMQFNGTTAKIVGNSTYGINSRNITLSMWVYNPTATNSGLFMNVGNGSSTGFGVGIGAARADNSTPGTKLLILYENVRWAASTTDVGTGWHYVVAEIDGNGNPSAYIDGVAVAGLTTGNPPAAPTGTVTLGGSQAADARFFKGSLDDMRVYNRQLSLAEIITLYGNGAQ